MAALTRVWEERGRAKLCKPGPFYLTGKRSHSLFRGKWEARGSGVRELHVVISALALTGRCPGEPVTTQCAGLNRVNFPMPVCSGTGTSRVFRAAQASTIFFGALCNLPVAQLVFPLWCLRFPEAQIQTSFPSISPCLPFSSGMAPCRAGPGLGKQGQGSLGGSLRDRAMQGKVKGKALMPFAIYPWKSHCHFCHILFVSQVSPIQCGRGVHGVCA